MKLIYGLNITRGTLGRIVIGLGLAISLSLFSGVLGMYVNSFFEGLPLWGALFLLLLLGVVLLGFAITFLKVMANSAEPVARFMPVLTQSKKVLVLPLSILRKDLTDEKKEELIAAIERSGWNKATISRNEEKSLPSPTLKEALGKLSWVMNLCAIRPHLEELELLCLIASRESGLEIWRFIRLRHKLEESAKERGELPFGIMLVGENGQRCRIRSDGDDAALQEECGRIPWPDFNNYDSILEAFQTAVQIAHEEGYEHGDMSIDITPGTKPVSIAGAAIALNSQAILSYVTNDREVRYHTTHIDPGLLAAEIR